MAILLIVLAAMQVFMPKIAATRDVTVRIYENGVPVWTETHYGVDVRDGMFAIEPGIIRGLPESIPDGAVLEIDAGGGRVIRRELHDGGISPEGGILEELDVGMKLGLPGEDVLIAGDRLGIGLGTTTSPSAILEIASEEDGVLIPRMTQTQRDGITAPETGLTIYNTDCDVFNYFDGTLWRAFPDYLGLAPSAMAGPDSVCSGGTGSFSIDAVAEATSYNWTFAPTGTIVSGDGTESITLELTSGFGNVCVEIVTPCGSADVCHWVTVSPVSAGGSVTPDNDICLGDPTPTMTLSGHIGAVIRWQRRIDGGGWTDITHTGTTFSETPGTEGIHAYRAVVRSGVCAEAFSTEATVTVAEPPVGGEVTGGGTISLGDPTPTLTLSGYSGTIDHWEHRVGAGSWTSITHTATTYSETPTASGIWQYRVGITRGACSIAYSVPETVIVTSESDSVVFSYTGAIESWTVPAGVSSIEIEAWGAQGGTSTTENPLGYVGGRGARMRGTFSVTAGDQLLVLVGQMGESVVWNGGGGGGSWVLRVDSGSSDIMTGGGYSGIHVTPLVVAGGGGGIRGQAEQNGNAGVTSSYATTGSGSNPTGGGVVKTTDLGLGGVLSGGSWGSAGGGFRGNGATDNGEGGHSMLSGGAQAARGTCYPGYGGTGGGGGNGCAGGGGGGGYSGGDGGWIAGGGGSWNSGTAQDNAAGIREGNGLVVIRF